MMRGQRFRAKEEWGNSNDIVGPQNKNSCQPLLYPHKHKYLSAFGGARNGMEIVRMEIFQRFLNMYGNPSSENRQR